MYLFVSYMLYSLISQIKKVFNPANAIQRLSNKITIALIIHFGNLKKSYGGCSSTVEKLFVQSS